MPARDTLISRIQLLIAALLFSTGGAAIKATTLNAWQVACFRSGVGGLALFTLLPSARRVWNRRALLVALAYASTMVMYVAANKLTTSANSIFLQATAPLYLLLLGPWLLKEPIRRADLLLTAVLAAGLSLFFVGEQTPLATAPDPFRGNLIAAASGVAWALTIGGIRWVERYGAGAASVVIGNAIAFLGCLPLALPVDSTAAVDWIVIPYLGVFQIGLAYVFTTRALRHVPALEASLLLLLEPALNPVWSLIVHGEVPHLLAVVGGALILVGTVGRAIYKKKP